LDSGGDFVKQVDPKFNMNWVKKVCTATAIDGFIAYFPFILLVMALVIVLIERVFIRYSIVKCLKIHQDDFEKLITSSN
jgi:hypothetical protein